MGRELCSLSLTAIKARYRQIHNLTLDDPIPTDRSELIRRILIDDVRASRMDKLAEFVRNETQKPRFSAQDFVAGRARILHCDRCRHERAVSAAFVEQLRTKRPSVFLCSECRSDDARRSSERAGLERTRKQIERERARKGQR